MPEGAGREPHDDRDEAKRRLAVKDDLVSDLFSELRKSKEQFGEDVCVLSYNPDFDQLYNERDENADIFTCQTWAALKAWEVFEKVKNNLQKFERLKIAQSPNTLEDYDRIGITLVGSSVSGLTFHAILYYLFEKILKRPLADFFEINFIDSHQRPLQRLLQARDRMIVPRFEYERILDLDEDAPEVTGFLEKGSDELIDNWNAIAEEKGLNIPAGVHFMPPDLCWNAASVRSVASQLLDGYNALTHHKYFKELANVDQAHSSTGGPIFKKTVKVEQQSKAEKQTKRIKVVKINDLIEHKKSNNNDDNDTTNEGQSDKKNDKKDNQESTTFGTDFVLLATGPGVDISPLASEQLVDNSKKRYLHNSQRSFWNPPKMELDVVEPDARQVLVLGNGDSAAGAIFATLFKDPEACTFSFLTDLLKNEDYREWFSQLREEVATSTESNKRTTRRWLDAMKKPSVLRILYEPPVKLRKKSGQKSVEDLLRSSVQVAVAIRADEDEPIKLNGAEDVPAFIHFDYDTVHSPSPILASRFLQKAWPENRIVGALLMENIIVFQENSSDKGNFIELVTDSINTRLKRTEIYTVPLFKIKRSYNDVDDKILSEDLIFKYVLDCRGRKFFSKYGNFAQSVEAVNVDA